MTTKQKEILSSYQESVANYREALHLAEMPESLILFHTINLPNLNKLIPEDVLKLFKEVKIMTVLYLDSLGFSSYEIEKRLGGNSNFAVRTILKEYKEKPPMDVTDVKEEVEA